MGKNKPKARAPQSDTTEPAAPTPQDESSAPAQDTSSSQPESQSRSDDDQPDTVADGAPDTDDSTPSEEPTKPVEVATEAPPEATQVEEAPTKDTPPPVPPKSASPPPEAPAVDGQPAQPPHVAPERRRPKPPTRGILRPPPPPPKATLGGRLRDIVGSVTGEAPASHHQTGERAVNAAVGTLNAISGRLGLGFGRFANHERGNTPPSVSPTPRNNVPPRAGSLPNGPPPAPLPLPAERPRQKQPLKRATFVLPSMSITYPISSMSEPWSAKVLEDREKIEARQRLLLTTASGANYWTSIRLIKLYESACRGREEKPRLAVIRALQSIPPHPKQRVLHLVLHDSLPDRAHPSPYPLERPLNRYGAEALADVLAVEWALSELKLERGAVETVEALKPILHALLVSGTLPSLSLAGNRRIKAEGWYLVAEFLKRARSLKFLDVSETNWDRRGIEFFVQGLNSTPVVSGLPVVVAGDASPVQSAYSEFLPPTPFLKGSQMSSSPAAVQSLRMDNCGFRAGTLDALAHGIRSSDLKHISLRNNRIGSLSAVALAVMIRDYPDTTTATLSPLGIGESPSFAPRQRRGVPPQPPVDDSNLPPIPLVTSSGGGVTQRVVPEGYKPPPPSQNALMMPGGGYSAMQESSTLGGQETTASKIVAERGASLALQRSVRALENVERIGRLLTLDLKSNDIRQGVSYIAQVLKRNRTLRVLNLSDNKIDPAGLVALAEALKYNSTLETLDLSSNPCCGPSLEGIGALRTSFTVNRSLKRLFIADTGLTTEGAIDLAEFIPENRSLLHLDVTNNPNIGAAGMMAVASGLKSNKMIRCLDVSIPPNDPNLAELSQSILQSCIRNTELAAEVATKGSDKEKRATEAIWGPIKKSALVAQVKAADAARAEMEREQVVNSVEGVAREYVYRLQPENLVSAAEDTARGLDAWFSAGSMSRNQPRQVWDSTQMPKDDFRPLVERAKALTERIAETLAADVTVEEPTPTPGPTKSEDDTDTDGSEVGEVDANANAAVKPDSESADKKPDTKTDSMSIRLERLLTLNDKLTAQVGRARGFMPPPRILLPSQIAFSTPAPPVMTPAQGMQGNNGLTPRRNHTKSTSLEISSPNFSIGDSDAESDAEELHSAHILPRVDGLKPAVSIETDPRTRTPTPNEDMAERLVDAELAQGLSSPKEESRRWVEEEAEVFRKGTRLGVVDSDSDDEVKKGRSGEELRKEIMETEVPRSPPRSVRELSDEEGDGEGEGDGEERVER